MLYSHPNKFLRDHLRNVGVVVEDFVCSKVFGFGSEFCEVAYLIGVLHDFGKATRSFQVLISTGSRVGTARHSLISGVFTYFVLKFLLKRGYFGGLDGDLREFLPLLGFVVVSEHHGELRDLFSIESSYFTRLSSRVNLDILKAQVEELRGFSVGEVAEIYSKLISNRFGVDASEIIHGFLDNFERVVDEIKGALIRWMKRVDLDKYFLVLLFFSVLIDADRLDAVGLKPVNRILEIPPGLVDDYKRVKFGVRKSFLDKFREEAYRAVISKLDSIDIDINRIFSITLPTGAGKTLTSFSFALKLREKIRERFGFTPRIIYSLPFLSIIEQNFEVIRDVLENYFDRRVNASNLLLKHHHLVELSYVLSEDYCDEEFAYNENSCKLDPAKSSILIEGWHSEIVVTTFVQFFHSIFTNKRHMARKFHNLINSVIILDEVQSIPHKYWLLVNKVLKYIARKYNCWIILVTATQPLIFHEESMELVPDKERYFTRFNRVKFRYDGEINMEDFKKKLLDEILETEDSILVVLNTIGSVKELYNYLKENLEKELGETPTINSIGVSQFKNLDLIALSTHIIPHHRQERIKYIRNSPKRKIVITTQLIEAGVDISFKKVYRDLAPFDSIIQSAGRCNRNFEWEYGDFRIITLYDNKGREYWKYIYDPILVDSTKKIIEKYLEEPKDEKDFVDLVEEYYKEINRRSSKDTSKEILKAVETLSFNNIKRFKLIEERYINASIYIEINKEARDLRKELEEILSNKKIDKYKKREIIRNTKRKMQKYIINIMLTPKAKKTIENLNFIANTSLLHIPKTDLNHYYNTETGFKTKDVDDAIII